MVNVWDKSDPDLDLRLVIIESDRIGLSDLSTAIRLRSKRSYRDFLPGVDRSVMRNPWSVGHRRWTLQIERWASPGHCRSRTPLKDDQPFPRKRLWGCPGVIAGAKDLHYPRSRFPQILHPNRRSEPIRPSSLSFGFSLAFGSILLPSRRNPNLPEKMRFHLMFLVSAFPVRGILLARSFIRVF